MGPVPYHHQLPQARSTVDQGMQTLASNPRSVAPQHNRQWLRWYIDTNTTYETALGRVGVMKQTFFSTAKIHDDDRTMPEAIRDVARKIKALPGIKKVTVTLGTVHEEFIATEFETDAASGELYNRIHDLIAELPNRPEGS